MRGTGLVLDIGGTTLRAGLYEPKKGLVRKGLSRISSPNFTTAPQFLLQAVLEEEIRGLFLHYNRPKWLAISICGPVSTNGVVHCAPPLWGDLKTPMPLQRSLERHLKVPVKVVNDLTAAAAGLADQPKYRKKRRICVVTVSSGLGNKVFDVKSKEALLGADGRAGELGHVRFDFSPVASKCDCGGRGHIAGHSSGRGAERLARRLAHKHTNLYKKSPLHKASNGNPSLITAEMLAKACRRGDKLALEALGTSVAPLARACALLSTAVGIDKLILMGGFAQGVGATYRRTFLEKMTEAGVFGQSATALGGLVDMAANDDFIGLRGVGLLAQRTS
jgi:predicted NBD/HSP70 family sugar kinase